MKKSSTILLFSLLFLSVFLSVNKSAYAKTSFSSLIPIATMREPLTEEKDLDSCFAGLFNTVIDLISGGSGGGGCSLDSLARIVAQGVAGTEFQSMMNMVGEGFFGDPAFLTDPESYYKTITQEVTNNFMQGVDVEGMIPSVLAKVKTQILQDQSTPYQDILSQGENFPGGESGLAAFEEDWNACPGGDGWKCFLALLEPKNDPFVAQRIVSEELAKKQKEALTHSSEEVAQGSGYLPVKKEDDCPKDEKGNVTSHFVGCFARTPGATLKDQMNTYLASSLEQIGLADELDEAIIATAGGLFGAVTNWLGDQSLIDTVGGSNQTSVKNITTNVICGGYKNACFGYVDGVEVTSSNVSVSSAGYKWSCHTLSCQMNFAVKGKCESSHYSCKDGIAGGIRDTNDKYLWSCLGSDNDTTFDDDTTCSEEKTLSCGTSDSPCINGDVFLKYSSSSWICSNSAKKEYLWCPI